MPPLAVDGVAPVGLDPGVLLVEDDIFVLGHFFAHGHPS